jgi:hypothetical protein
MPHYRDTVDSPLDQEAVFAYMADFTNAERWDPGTASARRLDQGELGVGSRFELMVSFAGRTTPFIYEITAHEPPGRLVIEADTDAVHLTDTVTVAPKAGGSVLTYDARLDLKGARKALAPVMAVLFRRLCEKAKAGLERELKRG